MLLVIYLLMLGNIHISGWLYVYYSNICVFIMGKSIFTDLRYIQ